MVDLSTEYLGLKLANPLVPSASPLSTGWPMRAAASLTMRQDPASPPETATSFSSISDVDRMMVRKLLRSWITVAERSPMEAMRSILTSWW